MSEQYDFINKIAPIICKEAKLRGYNFPSAIIAQAVIESGSGTSKLAQQAHNYFGMKAGSTYKGATITFNTKEQRKDGTYYTVSAKFRKYSSMEEGVKGYFDFISSARYSNLKEAISSYDYLVKIKNDGYATSLAYVDNVYNIVKKHNLLTCDTQPVEPVTPQIVEDAELDIAVTVIAKRCIAGIFGNGAERQFSIYKLVQNKVNDLLRK